MLYSSKWKEIVQGKHRLKLQQISETIPTDSEHSHLQISRHFTSDGLFKAATCNSFILLKDTAQLGMALGTQDLVELGLVRSPASLPSLVQFLHRNSSSNYFS